MDGHTIRKCSGAGLICRFLFGAKLGDITLFLKESGLHMIIYISQYRILKILRPERNSNKLRNSQNPQEIDSRNVNLIIWL